MEAYAIIETGGKQYLVEKDDIVKVEKLDAEAGKKVSVRVLAISDGEKLEVGTPEIKKAKIKLEIIEQTKAKKVISFKKKRRKGFKKTQGHRQPVTVAKVTGI